MLENDELKKTRWFIDPVWYEKNQLSLSSVLKGYLCLKCSKKLKVDQKEVQVPTVLSALKNCCSKADEFIVSGMPVAEGVFRVLLSNGNQPLELGEILKRFEQRMVMGVFVLPQETLYRVLDRDQFYGITKALD
jgi:hypothetical protein